MPSERGYTKAINTLRLNGNPNWPGRGGGGEKFKPTREGLRKRKIFSEWLTDFYSANPKRLKKVMEQAILRAERGESRFLELIVQLVEGPIKQEVDHTHAHFVVSEAERERALHAVEEIKQLMEPKPIEVIPDGNTSEDPAGSE